MTDKLQARHETRVRIFTRRGWRPERAAEFATALAQRDEQRDDRRACIECAGLLRNGGCYPAQESRIKGTTSADRGPFMFTPVQDVLARCAGFSWQTK